MTSVTTIASAIDTVYPDISADTRTDAIAGATIAIGTADYTLSELVNAFSRNPTIVVNEIDEPTLDSLSGEEAYLCVGRYS